MKEIDFILNKLRFITNSRTDKELCEILDINYSTLDTWKNNNKIPEKRLFKIYLKLSINANDLIKDSQSQNINENQNAEELINKLMSYYNVFSMHELSGKLEIYDEIFKNVNFDTVKLDEKNVLFKKDINAILKSIFPVIENDEIKKESFKQYLRKWVIDNI